MPHQPGHGSTGTQVPATKAMEAGASSGNYDFSGIVNYRPDLYDRPGTPGENLASLFGNLNDITLNQGRLGGGGRGGGAETVEGNMDANELIALNPYMDKNVTSFDQGGFYNLDGTYTPYDPYEAVNRFQDKAAEHRRLQDQRLEALVRSGKYNPSFGGGTQFENIYSDALNQFAGNNPYNPNERINRSTKSRETYGKGGKVPEYGLGGFFRGLSNVVGGIFDAAGNIIDPALEAIGDGVNYLGDNVLAPAVHGTAKGLTKGVKMLGEAATDLGEAALTPGMDLLQSLTGGGSQAFDPYSNMSEQPAPTRAPVKKDPSNPQVANIKMKAPDQLANVKKSADPEKMREGDWTGNKPNPFTTPNVEEEVDYAAKGMKMPAYNQGGHFTKQANMAIAQNQMSSLIAQANSNRNMMMAKGGKFEPHMMYDPKTGKGYMANKLQDHLDMKKKGYDHRKRNEENYPKAAYGMKRRYTNGGIF